LSQRSFAHECTEELIIGRRSTFNHSFSRNPFELSPSNTQPPHYFAFPTATIIRENQSNARNQARLPMTIEDDDTIGC